MDKFNFDRNGNFYPLVIIYISSIHGIHELMSRHVIDVSQGIEIKSHESFSQEENKKEEFYERMKKGVKTTLIEPLALRSSFDSEYIDIDIDKITDEIGKNFNYLFDRGMSTYAAKMLLISAYEIRKNFIKVNQNQNHELWQFLRHLRNASAHNGKFCFKERDVDNNELKYKAKWGHLEIKKAMEGNDLFLQSASCSGYIGPADPIKLLWDIEQTFFKNT
jgi:hypothetical protein